MVDYPHVLGPQEGSAEGKSEAGAALVTGCLNSNSVLAERLPKRHHPTQTPRDVRERGDRKRLSFNSRQRIGWPENMPNSHRHRARTLTPPYSWQMRARSSFLLGIEYRIEFQKCHNGCSFLHGRRYKIIPGSAEQTEPDIRGPVRVNTRSKMSCAL